MPLKIALLGYGQMGKEIEKICPARGHKVTQKFDIDSKLTTATSVDDIDVFIDFTQPDAVIENVRTVAELKKPMVIGTTGWFGQIHQVENLVEKAGIGAIYAANFSIGT